MSIERLSLSAINPIAATGIASSGALVGATAKAVAFEVLGRLGDQFLQAAAQGPGIAGQPYPIGDWAEALGGQLGATPLQTLELERGLGALAGALASDMASLADGRTLDRLDAALVALGDAALPADASTLAQGFEDLASHIAQAR
ncbi:tetrahydromethanopterin S-methyltransferase subunit E [Novosphingobium chloroacetimidivorans]|uniref:Tetrahydromethanopterin S-methyltransferase subunit E n=1 Tax=Novosphingobium chloroacetimidivorans TaxID=1428314 RepID=A0A7W7NVZ9_9SPHN|nr:hypothetical protein [Novosphingobium chloroacetimidivorans]MBB4858831.1 tetrahydromethanopterin S-methyltransferase subunit E [Novosphingobium chloroacetimidivorans]